jgi:hypothetical protein
MKDNRIGGDDYIVEPQGVVYIGVHCLRGKKPPVEIRQVGITYYHKLPYVVLYYHVWRYPNILYHNLPYLKISQYTLKVAVKKMMR